MRARGTAAKPRPLRSPRRDKRPVAPEHSTFRRVAVFVPFSPSGAPRPR